MENVTIRLHSSKERMYETGLQMGMEGKALEAFMYACYEVELGLEVDLSTGTCEIVSVDGRKVEP